MVLSNSSLDPCSLIVDIANEIMSFIGGSQCSLASICLRCCCVLSLLGSVASSALPGIMQTSSLRESTARLSQIQSRQNAAPPFLGESFVRLAFHSCGYNRLQTSQQALIDFSDCPREHSVHRRGRSKLECKRRNSSPSPQYGDPGGICYKHANPSKTTIL